MCSKPSFLNSIQCGTPSTAAALGGNADYNRLPFSMRQQTETQWCWAAVSTSVSRFFNTRSAWTQCKVADKAWSRNDCCGGGASGPCNKPWYLDLALSIVNVFKRMTSSAASFQNTKREIDSGRPLCIRVGWAGGGGHFLAVIGWRKTTSGDLYYYVDDPIYGSQRIRKQKLERNYQGSGTWTHSYFVVNSASVGGGALARMETGHPEALGA